MWQLLFFRWEHCRLMLVLLSKSTVLHKISSFTKPFKKKSLSRFLVWYISKHTAPHLTHMYLTFFWQILHLAGVNKSFAWSIWLKPMFTANLAVEAPQSWRRYVNSNSVFIKQIVISRWNRKWDKGCWLAA